MTLLASINLICNSGNTYRASSWTLELTWDNLCDSSALATLVGDPVQGQLWRFGSLGAIVF